MKTAEYKYPFYLHQRFDNFELFAAAVRGWDVDFRQLDCGEFRTEIKQLATPEVLITEALFNRRLDQKGGAPPGYWTFGLLEASSPDVKWRGQTMSDQVMAVFPPGSDIDASSPPGFHVLTISIRADVIEGWNVLNQMEGSGKIQPLCTLINLDPISLAAIRRTACRAITAAGSCRSTVHETVQEMLNLVVGALSDGRSIKPSPSNVKRTGVVKLLTAYIDAQLQNPISLAELCTVANVSPRTIQYTFMDRFGVSPKQYIQARRLNGVHRDLCKANLHGKKISDIANDWGFWHMGQFAADYRKFIGELPSETLGRNYFV